MYPRPKPMEGSRGPALRRGLVVVGLVSLLALGACSRGSPATEPTDGTDSNPGTTTTSATSTSTTVATTTTALDVTADVLAAWKAFWDAWATVRASEDLDPAPLEAVADSGVVDGAVALFERQRESGRGVVETEVVTHGKVTEAGSGDAVVEDCVLLSPSFTEQAGVWYEADLRNQGGSGWVVADLRIRSITGCIPGEMATAAIVGYEAYYVAEAEFWDPPDPDHSLINEVLADPQLSFVVGVLQEHKERGVALRGQPRTHPEVIEVRSPTEFVILDCYEPSPDSGLYDLDSGDRLSDPPPVREGQRNLRSAVMVFEDEKWKVSDLQGQVDFACEFAPTGRGLPSV